MPKFAIQFEPRPDEISNYRMEIHHGLRKIKSDTEPVKYYILVEADTAIKAGMKIMRCEQEREADGLVFDDIIDVQEY